MAVHEHEDNGYQSQKKEDRQGNNMGLQNGQKKTNAKRLQFRLPDHRSKNLCTYVDGTRASTPAVLKNESLNSKLGFELNFCVVCVKC